MRQTGSGKNREFLAAHQGVQAVNRADTRLDKVIRIKAGTAFYIRIFLIGLVLIALSAALDVEFALKQGAVVMEYVWKVADGLSTVFGQTTLFIFGYLILVTILIAVLRKKHGK